MGIEPLAAGWTLALASGQRHCWEPRRHHRAMFYAVGGASEGAGRGL